jgi:type I restriction-modification system DNA methylase subunit
MGYNQAIPARKGLHMPAPDSVKKLVENFELHRREYLAGKYNETQLRNEFLNPFFEALGWDVLNKEGNSEEYKHVIHEDSLDVEGVKKAPDYAFKIGKERKFFVEAKKPSVNIETNPEFAFQLRRYVWSAKLPLGILTDFEEFAVYECRSRPTPADKAPSGRVMLLSYRDYIEKWDEIASIFSHDAVMQGKFDAFANTAAKKKGTTEVDAAFLAEIEGWREALAKNLALRNRPNVENERDLNFAVQMIIDRIIFLRICEDRGFESENQLQEIANPLRPSATSPISKFRNGGGQGEGIYSELIKLFERADRRYNSGLFHFKDEKGRGHADTFTPHLEVDDKVLKDILKDLYYPAPYVFSQIPADILGQIYEQFLGKVIRLTAGHQAKVEEKPEVRKAGGVYYTPTFIVAYIVINTLGKLLNPTPPPAPPQTKSTFGEGGMTPKEASRLKILDPACGSGTFLLGAFQYLLEWHLKWYSENNPEKWAKGKDAVIYQSKDGWKLTTAKKKEILLNNIFGVDIDAQAVEVTKLSLLLKVIEDPGQLSMLDERILPDLGKNIQCGNSLIGPDYWDGQLLVDEEERARVNAFDWKAAFPEVFAQGGFDVVVGNPPYVRPHNIPEDVKKYLWKYYTTFVAKSDLYSCFMERGVSLLRSGGLFSFIVPQTWTSLESFTKIRKYFIDHSNIKKLIQLPHKVFADATVETCIFVLEKTSAKDKSKNTIIVERIDTAQKNYFERKFLQIDIENGYLHNFQLYGKTNSQTIIEKTRTTGDPLESFVDFVYGFKTGDDEKFIHEKRRYSESVPFIRSAGVRRYSLDTPTEFVWYVPEQMIKNKKTARPGDTRRFEAEKIIVARMGKALVASYDTGGLYVKDAMLLLSKQTHMSLKYLLGLINSRLMNYYYREFFITIDVLKNALLSLPIRPINFTDPADKARHDKMVSLVERMLALHKSLASAHTPSEKDRLMREVGSVDKSIDGLVYQLYGLSEEEMKIVEGKN